MCMVKPYYILAGRFGLFAVRLPSLSRGKWTWGCGITLHICTHDLHGSVSFIKIYKKNTSDIKIHSDALDKGYNVVIAERKKKNYHVI